MGLQVVGVLLFFVGVFFLLFFPVGTLLGVALMIVSARLGYKQTPIQKCTNCGYFFQTA